MTAPRTRRQPAAEPLQKREPGKGLGALLPQAADRTGDAPPPALEPPAAPPEPEPLRPRDYNEVLDQRYPATIGLTPGVPGAPPVYTGEISGAFDNSLREVRRDYEAATLEDHEHADREHAIAHSGRRLDGDACTYASWATEPPYRHHEPRELPTGWLPAGPVLSAGEPPEYGVLGDG